MEKIKVYENRPTFPFTFFIEEFFMNLLCLFNIILLNKMGELMVIKKAYIEQLKGVTLAGKSDSNHWVMMDGSEEFGGCRAACSPKELLLIALGGCTANDVIPILKKKRVELNGFEINLSGEEAGEHPKVFTKIHIEYIFYGKDIQAKDVERAIELSTTKYCSVSAMLSKSVEMNHTYKIINSEENFKDVQAHA